VRNNPSGLSGRQSPLALTPAGARFVLNADRPMRRLRINSAGTFVSCTSAQQTQIASAFVAAQGYANESLNVLQNANAPATAPRYTHWFGVHTASRYATVVSHFAAIAGLLNTRGLTGMGWDCSRTDCTAGAYAFVYTTDPSYTIHLCDGFWSAATSGTDSQAGTVIHEVSHFTAVAETEDHAYGQSASAALALSNPAQAVNNADNHEYFAENEPARSMGALNTATPTPTLSPTPTQTSAPTRTPTSTPTSTSTNTPLGAATSTATSTPTNIPAATATNTATNTPTNTPVSTSLVTSTPTLTPVPGPSSTPELTLTAIAGGEPFELFLPMIIRNTQPVKVN
jgi:hypothetical protein